MLQIVRECSLEPKKVVVDAEELVKTGMDQPQLADIGCMDLTRDLDQNLRWEGQKSIPS